MQTSISSERRPKFGQRNRTYLESSDVVDVFSFVTDTLAPASDILEMYIFFLVGDCTENPLKNCCSSNG